MLLASPFYAALRAQPLLVRPGGSQWNILSKTLTMTAVCLSATTFVPICACACASSTPPSSARSPKIFRSAAFFFTSNLPINKGTSLDLLVEMPEQVTGVPPAQWLCTGHVVRVVPTETEGKCGVGVQFDYYEVSRPERPRWAMGAGLRGPLAVSAHR